MISNKQASIMCTKESMEVPYFEIGDMIAKKRDGKEEMTTEEMNFWVKGVLAGDNSSTSFDQVHTESQSSKMSQCQFCRF